MGREVKRVPLDLAFEIDKPWPGYENPHEVVPCPTCNGYGRNQSFRAAETLAQLILIAGGDSAQFERRGGRPHPYFNSTPLDNVGPDLHELSAGLAGRPPSFGGHDAIDRWNATQKLIEAAGLDYETWGVCKACSGRGHMPDQEENHKLSEAWQRTEPPVGEGYQLWQTVSDAPISPVFKTPEELARYLSGGGYHRDCPGWYRNDAHMTYDKWLAFIKGPGWASSAVFTPETGLVPGTEFETRKS